MDATSNSGSLGSSAAACARMAVHTLKRIRRVGADDDSHRRSGLHVDGTYTCGIVRWSTSDLRTFATMPTICSGAVRHVAGDDRRARSDRIAPGPEEARRVFADDRDRQRCGRRSRRR